jgi:hypothetical protein
MSPAAKRQVWTEISRLLQEHEEAETEAVKTEIAKSYDKLRQRLQILAFDTAANDDESEPS